MDVSVIIPTYNRLHTLPRALDSVLSQTCAVVEIIVVDDGSTDGTADFIEANYPAVTLIRQHNLGVSAARNAGIIQSSQDWIAFLDSDDEWLPEKLEYQCAAIQNQADLSICHTDERWIRNGKRVNPMHKHAKPNGWIFQQCLPLCCVSPSSILLKKEVFSLIGDFDESLPACEDYDLWLRIFSRYPVLLVKQALLKKFGGHEDQLSRKYWGMDRFRVRALIKLLDSCILDESQTYHTIQALQQKLLILIKGFEKRRNFNQSEYYRSLLQKWILTMEEANPRVLDGVPVP